MAVDLFSFVAINPRLHPVGVPFRALVFFDDEGDLSAVAVSGVGGCGVLHAELFDVAPAAVGESSFEKEFVIAIRLFAVVL